MNVSETASLPDRLSQAFRNASAATGTEFGYLLTTAVRESALDTTARAPTSSAAGLFQFIQGTWLELIKEEGPKYGLTAEADAITPKSGGGYRVADPETRQRILALRDDPEIASLMAGEFTRRNADYLAGELGRQPTSGELYIAHFLGAGGAGKLIGAAGSTPDVAAADLFPAQAEANRSIFYKRGGAARSAAEVYAVLIRDHGSTPAQPPQPGVTEIASAAPLPPGDAAGARAAAEELAAAAVSVAAIPAQPMAFLPVAERAIGMAGVEESAPRRGRFAAPETLAEPGRSRFAPVSEAREAPPSRFAVLAVQDIATGAHG